MTRPLMRTAFLSILALAFPAVAGLAETVELQGVAPWKGVADDGKTSWSLAYDGSQWPGIAFSENLEPDTFYLVRWRLKASVWSDDRKAFGIKVSGAGVPIFALNYPATTEWADYAAYFNSGEGGPAKIVLFASQDNVPKDIQVKEIAFEKILPERLRENLLPDGDFEKSALTPGDWFKSRLSEASPASIVPSQGYLSGERSLQLNFTEAAESQGIQSIYLPIVPGRDFELRFWAKAEGDYLLSAGVDAWPPLGEQQGSHFHKMSPFKLSGDWKEYVLDVPIPDDLSAYPDLRHKLLFLRFQGEKGKAGQVLVDGVSFHLVK